MCATVLVRPADAQMMSSGSTTWYEAESAGMQALGGGNYSLAAASLRAALALKPYHPRLMFNLAAAYSKLGKGSEALKLLASVARTGLTYPLQNEELFAPLKDSAEFQRISEQFAQNARRVGSSAEAFRIPEKGLITESIAYDPKEQAFYVSSVRKRKIVRVVRGVVKDFSRPRDSLWSVLGMKVDAARRVLWACMTALPQMERFDESLRGASAIAKYDLITKKLLKIYPAPFDGRNHAFGDLALHPNGDVYVSDSETPTIFTIAQAQQSKNGRDSLAVFLASDLNTLPSLQGMDITDDGQTMIVADYANGLFAIDLPTKAMRRLDTPDSIVVSGIDGLYLFANDAIVIQNGVSPQRVMRLHLGKTRSAIEGAETLEANNPLFDEPTLGTLVGSRLYYICNSQWGLIDELGGIANPERLQEPRILMLNLAEERKK
jgi:sugar lactone lactonase YvrE